MNIGQYNKLTVIKKVPFGLYLDGQELGEILMPTKFIPSNTEVNDALDAFIYLDSEERLIATTQVPKAQVGECAYLEVIDCNDVGAFLDWGLDKDLLVPFSEQIGRMAKGEWHVVYVYLDEQSQTIAASSRLDRYLLEQSFYFTEHQAVDLLISARTELGFKAVINHTHLGLLYANEVFQPLSIGDRVTGYIKQIREDKLIDLTLQSHPEQARDTLMNAILAHLKEEGGQSHLTDKSSPDDIRRQFKVSKGNYKKALGKLYKQRLIVIGQGVITLV